MFSWEMEWVFLNLRESTIMRQKKSVKRIEKKMKKGIGELSKQSTSMHATAALLYLCERQRFVRLRKVCMFENPCELRRNHEHRLNKHYCE
jgi:hypothetical protein